MNWGEMTFSELAGQLQGGTAYKFEVVEGNVQLKVDGLMGSLKRSAGSKSLVKKGRKTRRRK